MKVGLNSGRLVGLDEASGDWVEIGEPWGQDLLTFLAGGTEAVAQATELMASATRTTAPAPAGLPFAPASLRAFALWESHMVNGGRGMVATFGSPIERKLAAGVEKLTGKTPSALKPKSNYYRYPQFYMGNHRSILADGETVTWPSFADVLDFELEIGAVLARPVRDCTPDEGAAAIGGFVVMNDLSARDTQWDDTRRGTFGGVVKAKTFAGAMSSVVVTADELLPRLEQLTGRVTVNGEKWAESSTAGPLHRIGAAVAYAARGESLGAGDVLSSGTLPGCCGLEMRRFPQPGDEVRLEIDGMATLTNRFGPKPAKHSGTGKESGNAVVVVTGCDSGIGMALALEFSKRGRTVYATGLRTEAMKDLAAAGLHTAELDVTDAVSIAAFSKRLSDDGVRPGVLVNNAGFGAMGPVIEMPLSDVRRQYDVNVFGLLNTTQQLAQPMIEARSGTIVNVGSTSGVMTSPFAGIYCSTKAAVHSITDAMRMELAPFGINVMRIEPNQIRTNFGDTAATGLAARVSETSRYAPLREAMNARAQGSQHEGSMPADEFARRVVDAVLSDKPPVKLRVGKELYPYTIFKPFLPSRRIDQILSKRFKLSELT